MKINKLGEGMYVLLSHVPGTPRAIGVRSGGGVTTWPLVEDKLIVKSMIVVAIFRQVRRARPSRLLPTRLYD
jgi:hypothetical protein